MSHIMISYARADAQHFAGRLAAELKSRGFAVWLDTAEIPGGADWKRALENAVTTCRHFIAVRTPAAKDSDWVLSERLLALALKKSIVPALALDCTDDLELIRYQPVDFRADFDAALHKLVLVLGDDHNAPAASVPVPTPSPDRRTLELEYLGKLLAEYKIWQTVYTPMAGVGQIRRRRAAADKPKAVTTTANARMQEKFRQRLHAQMKSLSPEDRLTEEKEYGDILDAIHEMRQLVILGDPGSGKTTTLWRIAADTAERATDDESQPLPLFLRLGELGDGTDVAAYLHTLLGDLAPHYESLEGEKGFIYLLDGLNEMASADPALRRDRLSELKGLVEKARAKDRLAAVTCRELDYTGDLEMGIAARLTIEPLDPLRIHRFIEGYIRAPEDAADRLFWQIAGDEARGYWNEFVDEIQGDAATFWLHDALPSGQAWGFGNWIWGEWIQTRRHPRSLMTLAANPYMLYMMTQVFADEGFLPPNRGDLFRLFVDFLLIDREGMSETAAAALGDKLAALAYEMQATGQGTGFDRDDALSFLGEENVLYRARSASLLTGDGAVRFTHQLLQEYFAARQLDRERLKGTPATAFWSPATWWQPTRWEETAILLAGLYSEDSTPVLRWLQNAQPELTARCVLESGAFTPPATPASFKPLWLPRLTDEKSDPAPHARAAVGRALGMLHLDDRTGVGVRADGLPDFEWVRVEGGTYALGGDNEAFDSLPEMEVEIEAFMMARYPVTYAQYEPFVEGDGYSNRAYWTAAGWAWREKKNITQPAYWQDANWHIANHPVVGVSWYEAYAYGQWVSAALGQKIRLPSEVEWEAAARGKTRRIFSYAGHFNPFKCCNTRDTGIGRPSAVGIFPLGATPEGGIEDMTGNVWEWTQTVYEKGRTGNNDSNSTGGRVLRGGSWLNVDSGVRAASRGRNIAGLRLNNDGFRCARSY